MSQNIAIRTASLLALVLLWVVAAWLANDPTELPSPFELIPMFAREIANGELFFHLFMTLWRVIAAFFFAMSFGLAIGLLMGMRPDIDRWLDPWLVVFLNLPALVLIVLCYLWIGLTEFAAILAVTMNKIPNVVIVIREGARALDGELASLVRVYRMSRIASFRHVLIPQMVPYIAAAARSGLAVIWKIVLVVEFLGRSNGVGFQIHLYFQLFEVGYVLVYALAFIAVMLVVEMALLQPWERRVNRWRHA